MDGERHGEIDDSFINPEAKVGAKKLVAVERQLSRTATVPPAQSDEESASLPLPFLAPDPGECKPLLRGEIASLVEEKREE